MSEAEVTCPYCGEDFELELGDGQHYEDGKEEEDYCPSCDKKILVSSSCTWYREAHKADCLNGSPHPFSEWRKLWEDPKEKPNKQFMRRYCTVCDKEEMEWRDNA